MSAVDGEDLKLLRGNMTHPAGNLSGLPISKASYGALEVDESRLSHGKVIDGADGEPAANVRAPLYRRRKQISGDRNSEHGSHDCIQEHGDFEQERPARVRSCLSLGRQIVIAGLSGML
jgi:hypothetical protein